MVDYIRRLVKFLSSIMKSDTSERELQSIQTTEQRLGYTRTIVVSNGENPIVLMPTRSNNRRVVNSNYASGSGRSLKRKSDAKMEPPCKKVKFSSGNQGPSKSGIDGGVPSAVIGGVVPVPLAGDAIDTDATTSGSGWRRLPVTPAFVSERPIPRLELLLKWMLHAKQCVERDPNETQCNQPFCREMQQHLLHVANCARGRDCPAEYCVTLRQLMLHYEICWRNECGICSSARLQLKQPASVFQH